MKKNLFPILLLTIILFSCSNEYENESLELKTFSNSTSNRSMGDGLYDALGYGYDITKGFLSKTPVKKQIIDVKKLVADYPNATDKEESSFGIESSSHYVGIDIYEYLDARTRDKNIQFDSSLKALNLSRSMSSDVTETYKTQYEYSSKYSFASGSSYYQLKRLYFRENVNILKKYLESHFKDDMKNKSAEYIVQNYGTHILLDIAIGGKLEYLYRGTAIKSTSTSETYQKIKNNFTLTVDQVTQKSNLSDAEYKKRMTSNDVKNQQLVIKFIGGNGFSGEQTIDLEAGNISKFSINLNNWAKSILDYGYMRIIDINWNEFNKGAIPIYELIDDSSKKQAVKQAVIKYIKDAEIKKMELIPLYRVHNRKYNNTFDVAGDDNLIKILNEPTFGRQRDYECLLGYILKYKASGTDGLWTIHNKKYNNTFTEISKAKTDKWVDKNRYIEDFLGYAYTNSYFRNLSYIDKNNLLQLRRVHNYRWDNSYSATPLDYNILLKNGLKHDGDLGYIYRPD